MSTRLLSIDPGFKQSGWLLCESEPFRIVDMGITPNDDVRVRCAQGNYDVLVIEHIAMGGMIAGQETFDTCFEAGRFAQAALPRPFELLKRIKVKLHLCGQARAKDSNIRQSLIDRFGGSEAIGKKAHQGPLYGVKAHIWAALALAVTYLETTLWTDGRQVCDPRARAEGKDAGVSGESGVTGPWGGADDHLVAAGDDGVLCGPTRG